MATVSVAGPLEATTQAFVDSLGGAKAHPHPRARGGSRSARRRPEVGLGDPRAREQRGPWLAPEDARRACRSNPFRRKWHRPLKHTPKECPSMRT